jgi:hypothetical protein
MRLPALVSHKTTRVADERTSYARAKVSELNKTLILKSKEN